MPRYDSSLPWKEKQKILEAEIKAKKKALIKERERLRREITTEMSDAYHKGYKGKYK